MHQKLAHRNGAAAAAVPPAPPRAGKEAGARHAHLLFNPVSSVLSNGEVRLSVYSVVSSLEPGAERHLFSPQNEEGKRGEFSRSQIWDGGKADFTLLQR